MKTICVALLRQKILIIVAINLCATMAFAEDGRMLEPAPKGWPEDVKTVAYQASIDASQQPMLLYTAKAKEKRPLLVGLHTWSGGYEQAGGEVVYARWCMEKDWHFIHPDFRGPNRTPQACGSEMAVQDILDAVTFMQENYAVDADRIYLVGASGGGYASLLMAGRAPEIWAGVSAWVPINDLKIWWEQCDGKLNYAEHIEKVVGGKPDHNQKAVEECVARSAVTYLDKAAGVNLDINAGVTDGHKGGSVPFSHSLYTFNKVVPEQERIDPALIEAFYEAQALPEGLEMAQADSLYGEKQPIFRKVSKNTRVTIFNGKHEIIHIAALNWLAQQRKSKAANWDVVDRYDLKTSENEDASGK
jgi:dienelactone hydrolase